MRRKEKSEKPLRAKKAFIIRQVKARYFPDLPLSKCAKLVDGVFSAMKDYLKAGVGITISNFGTFSVKSRAARKARNVHTGEELLLSPSKKVVFIPTPEIKRKISSGGS